jgi:NitT/TauT family transport system substrate-binding protein
MAARPRWARGAWRLAPLLLAALVFGCVPASNAPQAPLAAPQPPPSSVAAPAAPAPTAPPLHLRAAYTSETAAEIPLWFANDTGLFPQYGLDVGMERVAGGSSKAVQVMMAGELDVAQIGGAAVVDAGLAGADLLFIATLHPLLALTVYAVPGLTAVDELRGKSMGITRAGTISDFTARYVLSRANLQPESDVGLVQTGGVAETLAAMQSANVPAGVLSPPFDVPARKLGFHELIDVPGLGLEFPHQGIAVSRDYLARNEEALRRYMRATVDTIARIKQDKALAKQIIAKYSQTDDDEAAESGYAAFGDRFLARAPYPTAAQFEPVIQFVAERDPRARDLRAATLVDDRFVRALDQEGFIAALYR